MTDQFAPWITDPDAPADIPNGNADVFAKNVAAMFPELVDKSLDGPLAVKIFEPAETLKIDLNNLPGNGHPGIGDPHWLSGSGKVDRQGIYKKHRDKAMAELKARPRKPARPETVAKLMAAQAHARKTEQVKRVKVWNTAISILDRSEITLRDLIERELSDIAGLSGVLVGDAMQTTESLMKKIRPIRLRAFKKAFRYLREHL